MKKTFLCTLLAASMLVAPTVSATSPAVTLKLGTLAPDKRVTCCLPWCCWPRALQQQHAPIQVAPEKNRLQMSKNSPTNSLQLHLARDCAAKAKIYA